MIRIYHFIKFSMLSMMTVWMFGISFSCYAAATLSQWKIVPTESHLTFTATQNDAPVSGEFKKFTGDIFFDPDKLAASHVRIVVETNSLSTAYKDLTDTLAASEWLDIKLFPTALFTAEQFKKIAVNTYQANGNLTIRDKTIPITLIFTQEKNNNNQKVRVKGSTQFKRTAFGIGQGEWASTNEVKDEVQVNFVLSVVKL